jgi:predicted pyridoxine 5'-phosphate oxidase superfamily flavin-nucleotide-binding protein/ferredoxin
MAEYGWIKESSPFHWAARAMQDRLGVREETEKFGRRVIRDYMTAEIREFLSQLPFLLIGAVDACGRPWASLLAGVPGFASSTDPRTLSISAMPLPGDPLNNTLLPDASVSVLGIEFHSRRRNSVNGRILSASDKGFKIQVDQSFGNCPQYIQRRRLEIAPSTAAKAAIHHARVLGEAESTFIAAADTFFIASYFLETNGDTVHGVDVSHRGGKPGFVCIEDERTIAWPDFVGNFQFNTLGNIAANPRAGLLFIGFETGDLLYMTGAAEIIWDSEEVRAFAGCERIVRFRIDDLIRSDASLPFRWRFEEYSPTLGRTGSWEPTKDATAAASTLALPYDLQDHARMLPSSSAVENGPVEVIFAKLNVAALWDSSKGSLLELAEDIGLTPKYGCRSGMCGACAVKILAGDVEYLRPTLLEPEAGMALICKATPKRSPGHATGMVRRAVTLDV